MSDLVSQMPVPELADWVEHLVDPAIVAEHCAKLLSSGTLKGVSEDELADALARTWLLYLQGTVMAGALREQKGDAEQLRQTGYARAADLLATPPRNRPKQYRDHAFIQAMWVIWERHSPNNKGWRSYNGMDGAEYEGRFPAFVNEWMRRIDPKREDFPSRNLYEVTKRRLA